MFNYVVILTDALASGYSVKAAARLARVSEVEAKNFFDENADAIEERRRDIKEQFAIVNPVSRIEMLNHVARLGIDGYTVVGKNGKEVLVRNPGVTVQAIKTYSEMEERLAANASQTPANTNEQEKIIRHLFDEIRGELGAEKAAQSIRQEFPDYADLVEEWLRVKVEQSVE